MFAKKMFGGLFLSLLMVASLLGCDYLKTNESIKSRMENVLIVDTDRIMNESLPAQQRKQHMKKVKGRLQESAEIIDRIYGEHGSTPSSPIYNESMYKLNRYFDEEDQLSYNEVSKALVKVTQEWMGNRSNSVIIARKNTLSYSANIDITDEIIKIISEEKLKFRELPSISINMPNKKSGSEEGHKKKQLKK